MMAAAMSAITREKVKDLVEAHHESRCSFIHDSVEHGMLFNAFTETGSMLTAMIAARDMKGKRLENSKCVLRLSVLFERVILV